MADTLTFSEGGKGSSLVVPVSSLISQRNAFVARLNQKGATLTTMMSEALETRFLLFCDF